jgi:hypothetical protein
MQLRLMRQHVRLHIRAMIEGLPADMTSEWFLSCMSPHVYSQVTLDGESLPTHLALVRLEAV